MIESPKNKKKTIFTKILNNHFFENFRYEILRNRNTNLERGRKGLANYRNVFGQRSKRDEEPRVSYHRNMHDS